MDKKIIKALYGVTAKDKIRPLLEGVYFDKKCCVATDTHLLVVYNESSEKHAGKVLSITGEEIKGKYPPYQRVIPKKAGKIAKLDCGQLYRACAWWSKQKESNDDDSVVLEGTAVSIKLLARMLGLFALTRELSTMHLYINEDSSRPIKATSEVFTAILMPHQYEPDAVDEPRVLESERMVVSYENLINTFAIESTKPKEASPADMDWL